MRSWPSPGARCSPHLTGGSPRTPSGCPPARSSTAFDSPRATWTCGPSSSSASNHGSPPPRSPGSPRQAAWSSTPHGVAVPRTAGCWADGGGNRRTSVCGLGGELRFDGLAADVRAVERMSPCLRSRGPDGCGTWSVAAVALLHHRLKIIDLSDAGAQPMEDAELGLTVVFNGCIYNHQQLRTDLESAGYQFRSHSDTEVIVKAYHKWGTGCVDHFLGMFAFAVYEHQSGRLVLARDRLGIEPLNLAETLVAFASPRPCRRCSPPATWTPPSTSWRCTTTCPGIPSSPRRARSSAGSETISRHPPHGRGRRHPLKELLEPLLHSTSRSAPCSPAASTPVSSWRCSPNRVSGCRRSASASLPPAGKAETSSPTPTSSPSDSGPTITRSVSANPTSCRPWRPQWAP